MKNNYFTGILVGLLFLSTLASIIFMWRYNSTVHLLQKRSQDPQWQAKLAEISNAQSIMTSLYNDTVAYSQTSRNPDIMRLLQEASSKSPRPK